ncbi:MAG: DUF3800 domain-containing protein [Nitrospiraceae bacterium]|nr:DUF3800 domain-containing protein [Nitrospira sp.]MCA9458362.1 DUF3800 domain-containing protein [Nitrospira sp.]MCB9774181.1 DUF3800 domain-containing protein [Nitrospiraceae bacterium]
MKCSIEPSGVSRFSFLWQGAHPVVLMLTAYLDDSGHKDDASAPIFSVGGVVAPKEAWSQFEMEWGEVLKSFQVKQAHMKHFAHKRGEFEGWSEDKRRAFLGQLMKIMDVYVNFYVGAVLPVEDFKNLPAQKRNELNDPYFACFQVSIHGVGIYVEAHFPDEKVDIVFDRRAKSKGLGGELFDRCIECLEVGNRLGTLTFGTNLDFLPLQAADLVAYELNHYRRGSGKIAESRWPIQELVRQIKNSDKECFFDFFDSKTRPLGQFL